MKTVRDIREGTQVYIIVGIKIIELQVLRRYDTSLSVILDIDRQTEYFPGGTLQFISQEGFTYPTHADWTEMGGMMKREGYFHEDHVAIFTDKEAARNYLQRNLGEKVSIYKDKIRSLEDLITEIKKEG